MAENPTISKITLPSGTTYDIKDAVAREKIEALSNYTAFLGVTSTALSDGATTAKITVDNKEVTAVKGNVALYGNAEFIFNGEKWQEFGDLSALGTLAYKNSASGSYTPAGSVSLPKFTGTQGSISASVPSVAVTSTSGTATYTPGGTVSTPTITVTPTTGTTYSITNVGSAPSFAASVSGETLAFSWNAGTVPSRESKTFMTGASATSNQPAFTGTGARLVTAATTGTGTFTPAGTVSKPTFSGTGATITVS